jgi:adenylate cyclase
MPEPGQASRSSRRLLVALLLSLASAAAVLALHQTRFFRLLDLKAYDLQYLARGPRPVANPVLLMVDQKSLDRYPEPLIFWHPYYAEAIRAAARSGAKVFGLDVFFAIPVGQWEKDHDRMLAQAVVETSTVMPVVCGFVSGGSNRQHDWTVPLYLFASASGLIASAHLSVDPDDFIRRQQLLEDGAGPVEGRVRSLGLRLAEKFVGQDVHVAGDGLYLGEERIPGYSSGAMVINYAGPAATIPHVSLADFLDAARAGDDARLRAWVAGKIVLLGIDTITSEDRHATPFYTLAPGLRANTAGVEIQANIANTILSRAFLREPPPWAAMALVWLAACGGVAVSWRLRPGRGLPVLLLLAAAVLLITHLAFRSGVVLSPSRLVLALGVAAVVTSGYRLENRRAFFERAFSIFVGRRAARSLAEADHISVAPGARCEVTVLFSDIRAFTSFCDQKEPSVVVHELNLYFTRMVEIIVKHGGEVNKFLGDGILAVFSDLDTGSVPGDHPVRAVDCGFEMVRTAGRFRTGVGLHTGEVIMGNVGSLDKLENTVLGATVNVASRLESLNKTFGTQMLVSEATARRLPGSIPMSDLGPTEVRGAAAATRVFTPTVLAPGAHESEVGALPPARSGPPVASS